MLNMFVGVVVENFHKCREAHEKEERQKREARRLRKLAKKISSMVKLCNKMAKCCCVRVVAGQNIIIQEY